MQKKLSKEDLLNNFKVLVFEHSEDTIKNLDALFELSCTLNDIDSIKRLANDYFHTNAIKFLNTHNNENNINLIELINNDTEYSEIKDIIEKGIYINKKDVFGNTALIRASILNKVDIVKLLLENDADVHYKLTNGSRLVELIFQLGYKEILELLIMHGADNIFDEYANSFFHKIEKHIKSSFVAKQFVYEELDAARQGNDDASFVHRSGVKEELYMNAMSRSLPQVDGAGSPQQVLLFNCLMPIMNEDNRELVTRVRILTVEKVMSKYYIGKYENKITKLTLSNSIEILIHKEFALIDDEKFEYIEENKYYNPQRQYYLDIALNNAVAFYEQSYDDNSSKEYFQVINKEDVLKYNVKHNPKRLVEILNYFTKDNPIKYTAHSFDWSRYGTYENFMKKVKQTFEEVEDDLKLLSPNLYEKITKFLFSDKLNVTHTWGMNRIAFGWSSLELQQWAFIEESQAHGRKAINFPLPDEHISHINGRTITIFEDVCNVFKNEIEIRDDGKLSMLLEELEDEILGFDFEVEYKNLENISFYTDVEYIKNALTKIFEQFKEENRKNFQHIIIEAIRCDEGKYTDLLITQVDSKVTKSSSNMMTEVNDGDFQDIKNSFLSLCDWSIISEFQDGFFQIDYLSIENEKIVKNELKLAPNGFTHKLRFYSV